MRRGARVMGPISRQKGREREQQKIREEQHRKRAEGAGRAVRYFGALLVALVIGVLAILVYNLLFGG